MLSKFLISLRYVIALHFIQRSANEWTGVAKHPYALGAAVAVELLALDPYELARHYCPSPYADKNFV
ncbi:MAG TPA: hypothetical protein VN087_20620 [Verrucomicrobiae bacterium]|nr:hypothetical protein [Verrucomicrobiae bacterium]